MHCVGELSPSQGLPTTSILGLHPMGAELDQQLDTMHNGDVSHANHKTCYCSAQGQDDHDTAEGHHMMLNALMHRDKTAT